MNWGDVLGFLDDDALDVLTTTESPWCGLGLYALPSEGARPELGSTSSPCHAVIGSALPRPLPEQARYTYSILVSGSM